MAAARNLPELRVNVDEGTAEYFADGIRRATLVWNDGEIWTKVPEADVIAVMLRLAEPLKARVRGDEFETYRSPTETYIHPDDKEAAENAEALRQASLTKHKRFELAWNIVRVALLAIIALSLIRKFLTE